MPGTTTLAAGVMVAVSISALLAQSQNPPIYYRYAGTPDSAPKPQTPPTVLRLCIDARKGIIEPRACETWVWGDGHYESTRRQGAPAIIVVESFAADAMMFRLTDPAHPGKEGTMMAFMGRISPGGDSILDGMSLAKDGTPGQFKAYWGASLEGGARPSAQPQTVSPSARTEAYGPNGPQPIPDVMHFCAAHCLTFTLEKDGKLHNYTNLPGQHDEHRVLAIEKFTPDAVVIHRTDKGSHPGDGMMNGRMQYGNSSASGENWTISWGEALASLPADDNERAMRAGVQFPQSSIAEQNMSMLELLLGLFSPGTSSSSGTSTGSMIGCAPGYSGCPHIAGKH